MWIEEDEVETLAAALEMSTAAFARSYLRRARDPGRGISLSLRESFGSDDTGGVCALLRGARECAVYRARPRHCRSFPFWPSILEDPEAFERARQTCPGIVVEPDPELRERAFAELCSLYAEVDARIGELPVECVQRGSCCHFESYGHELFATALEVDYALCRHPDPPPPEAGGRCPYQRDRSCTAREGRPLGCRTFFCDPTGELARQELHEGFLARIRQVERKMGYPASYGVFPAMLRSRGAAERPPIPRDEPNREMRKASDESR